MPKILYVVNIPRFFMSHRLPLALAAQQAGYEVYVTTSDADQENVARIRDAGLAYLPLPLAQHGTNPLSELRTVIALYRMYRRLKPDIVHQVSIKPVLYGGIAAQLAGVRGIVSAMSGLGYVFIGDGIKPALLRTLIRPALWLALRSPRTRMIFQNEDDRARFVDMGLLPLERTALIRGSGVDITRFIPQPEPQDVPVVLFAGRLMWKKGLGAFVQAAKALHNKARFVVAGYAEASSPDNVPVTQLEAWASAGLIEWLGKRDDMPDVFANSNVVCLPSTYGEGVPKVLIEAAASGRAIVTTDTPGCRDIVQDGVNGLLVPPGDDDALIRAIERLCADDELRQRMGARGRMIAEDDFSLERVIKETFAVYDSLLAGG